MIHRFLRVNGPQSIIHRPLRVEEPHPIIQRSLRVEGPRLHTFVSSDNLTNEIWPSVWDNIPASNASRDLSTNGTISLDMQASNTIHVSILGYDHFSLLIL